MQADSLFEEDDIVSFIADNTGCRLAYSYNDKLIASCRNNHILIWEINRHHQLHKYKFLTDTETDCFRNISFHPDGKCMVSVNDNRILKVWNLETGNIIHRIKLNYYGSRAEFSADGKYLVVSGEQYNTIGVHDADNYNLIYSINCKSCKFTISADSKNIFDGEHRLYSLRDGKQIGSIDAVISNNDVYKISPDFRNIALKSNLNFITLKGIKQRQSYYSSFGIEDYIALSQDGHYLAATKTKYSKSYIIDIATKKKLCSINSILYNITFTTDCKSIIASNRASLYTGMWDIRSGKLLRTFTGDYFALSTDGKMLAHTRGYSDDSTNNDTVLYLSNPTTGETIRTIAIGKDRVRSLSFSHDNKKLLIAHPDKISIWDVRSGQNIKTQKILEKAEQTDFLIAISSPDGRFKATKNKNNLKVLEVNTGMILHDKDLPSYIYSIDYSPDSRYIMVAMDKSVEIYLSDSLVKIHEIKGGHPAKFSHDGKQIFYTTDTGDISNEELKPLQQIVDELRKKIK